ncbi:MAG: glycogen synthase [Gaiellaceae bacterium]|nr:glycogen synthase [Gaiellaceae bacterium]
MNVLFLTTEWPSEAIPTNGTFVREHALAAARECEVAVLDLSRSASTRGLVEMRRLTDETLPVWRIPYRRAPRPFSFAAFFLGALTGYRRLARAGFEPDVLHAHSFLSAAAALLLGRMHGKPVVYTEHWTIFIPENPGRLSPPMARLARFALEHADVVLAVSEDLRRALAEHAPNARVRVVNNAVDLSLFRPPANGRSANGVPRLLTVGLLDTGRKGVDLLLEAAALLRDRGASFALDIVGEGGLRPDYERLARDLELGDRVAFLGYRPKAAIADLMRRSDLFVLGSRYENNPCVVIEAMATGLPVVAPAVGGVPELIEPSAGELAPPLDPPGLSAALEQALSRLPEFDAATIARRAGERFGHEAIGAELAAVYRSCLDGVPADRPE